MSHHGALDMPSFTALRSIAERSGSRMPYATPQTIERNVRYFFMRLSVSLQPLQRQNARMIERRRLPERVFERVQRAVLVGQGGRGFGRGARGRV